LTPIFSIIVPSYNNGDTIRNTIESIASQSFKNFELILVEGGSTDDTLPIIEEFCSQSAKINCVIINTPPKGVYDAYNKAIAASKGSWLYFMGGDDVFSSASVLQNINKAIDATSVDLIYGNVRGITSGKYYQPKVRKQIFQNGLHHQGVFFNRKTFQNLGYYDVNFNVAADFYFMLKVLVNPLYRTQYFDIDIAGFGENGLSSMNYDYRFYSFYYRFLYSHNMLQEPEDADTIYNNSLYCCYQLAQRNEDVIYGWANLIFYLFFVKKFGWAERFSAIKAMVYWTIKKQNT